MILSANTLRKLNPPIVTPFLERNVVRGRSYGISLAGYDIRVAQGWTLAPNEFRLFSSLEEFNMPRNVVGRVCNKSSWARVGLDIDNTVIEPGWRGYLTLELHNKSQSMINIVTGDPIAQILFEYTDEETPGYTGKYQLAGNYPQEAMYEPD